MHLRMRLLRARGGPSGGTPALVGEVSGDAHNGEEGVGFRVLLADGYLVDVEIHGFGDNDASVWPAATIVR